MKRNLKWFFVILAMFCIGGLGSLFVNYIVFSKLVNNPKWSENKIVKALSNKVTVIQNTEKVVVKDNESLTDISSQVSAGVVYVEEILPSTASSMPKNGSGIVVSSDGIVAFHKSVFDDLVVEKYQISFFDGISKEAKKLYEDEYTGIVFLQVENSDLTTMPFADSNDIFGGKKLINVYREKNSEQTFYNLGILSGFDYDFQIKEPSCDYLQGAFRVDFNEKALKYGLGGPMIDFNGQMIGLLAKKTDKNSLSSLSASLLDKKNNETNLVEEEYFVIKSNDVREAFDRFLTFSNLDEEKKLLSENNRAVLESSCRYVKMGNLEGVQIFSQVLNNKKMLFLTTLGLKNNDIILQIGDEGVSLKNPLSKILTKFKKGDKAKVKLMREEKEMDLEVTF